jgi:RsiW-degrading membrane proteinase PrsW (M82 family)
MGSPQLQLFTVCIGVLPLGRLPLQPVSSFAITATDERFYGQKHKQHTHTYKKQVWVYYASAVAIHTVYAV